MSAEAPTPDERAGIDTQFLLARARTRLLGWAEEKPLVVGRYRVTRRLGEGGMSVVYAAHDGDLDREVAIKFLHSELATTPGWRDRLRREAQAIAKLAHPNVVHVYEAGEHEGRAFIVMELVRGPTLRGWASEAPRGIQETIAMHVQAGRGLAAAHEAGIVHRDYKPDNVIVSLPAAGDSVVGEGGHARVLDFGLARSRGEEVPAAAQLAGVATIDATTSIGSIMGTPPYMAPEQIAGAEVDARADEFAFCVALYEALHGGRPFVGNSLEQLSASMESPIVREHDPARPEVPEAVDAVLLRGLSRDPDARYPTMHELLAALEHAASREHREAQAELARKAKALDFTLRADDRWRHALGIGVVLTAIVGVLYALRVLGIHEIGYADAFGVGGLLVGLQLHSERKIIRAGGNEIDRRWARMLTMGSAVVVVALLFAWLAGFGITTGLAVATLAAAAASSTVALLVDARALVSTACLVATAFALVLAPAWRTLWLGVGLVGAYASLSLVWRQRR